MKRKAPLFVAIVAAALLAAGLFFGNLSLVWQKAAAICLECIGIG